MQDGIGNTGFLHLLHQFPEKGKEGSLHSPLGTEPYQSRSMGNPKIIALYVVLMIVVIVAVDFMFFRHRFWERLMANVGIVLIFGAFYFKFLNRP